MTDTEGLNRSVAHWAFLPAEHRGAFYRRRLLPWVLSRFAGLILQEPEATRARHLQALVTIVSGQKDTTVLVARALTRLGVRHCLLLYSRDKKQEQEQRAAEVRRELLEGFQYEGEQWPAVACEQHAFDPRERALRQLAEGIRAFCERFSNEGLVLDITGGKSLMKWVADHAMPEGSWPVAWKTRNMWATTLSR